MAPKTIFCYGEGRRFPASQFEHSAGDQLIEPYVHDMGLPHYAATGMLVHPDPTPPVETYIQGLADIQNRMIGLDEDSQTLLIRKYPELNEIRNARLADVTEELSKLPSSQEALSKLKSAVQEAQDRARRPQRNTRLPRGSRGKRERND